MIPAKRFAGIAMGAALLASTAACVTDPVTGERTISKAAIGAGLGVIGGYLGGDLIGGRNDRTEKIVGAGIGAIAGAGIGAYMDRQEQRIREQTAGSGVEVDRVGDELLLRMPAGVTFATNSYAVQPQFQPTLDEVARTLADFPSTLIDVYGHTDSTGSDAINIPLSQNRAQAVGNYLIARGVNPARIATQGFGSSRPIAENTTEVGKQANRRVEIRVVPVQGSGV
ncbi:OmpA family protein [Allosphingosinicella vermicomposti]|uniref:OmpA family protein n=1 Tax=Allosphingosinicella vermicomposti TaxID=614671 RepID=UPI000D0F6BEC|nr:OmpA family protein [Allosphingosinicella vermicomposti]